MVIIIPLVSDLTGLDNYNLTDQSKFSKNNGELINSFLTLLPSPYFDSEMDGSPCDGLMRLSTKIEVSKHENEPRGQKNRPDMSFNPHKQKQTSCSEKFSIFKSKLSKILSLINLHKFFLGCPPDGSHGAEADCLALLRTTSMLGDKWIDWVKNNCYLFEKCRKMFG